MIEAGWLVQIVNQLNALSTALTETIDSAPDAASLRDILHKNGSFTFDNTTDSLEAIRDALDDALAVLGEEAVAGANITTNTLMKHVVGNKTDALVDAVGTTKSLAAYIKGLVQELDQRTEPHLVSHYLTLADQNDYTDVVNITDKGVLTGITMLVDSTSTDEYVRITIDGSVIYDGVFGNTFNSSTVAVVTGGTLSFNHRFDTSLKVEHKRGTAFGSLRTLVSYTTD